MIRSEKDWDVKNLTFWVISETRSGVRKPGIWAKVFVIPNRIPE